MYLKLVISKLFLYSAKFYFYLCLTLDEPTIVEEVTINTIENNNKNEITFDPDDQPLSMPYAKVVMHQM